MSLPLQQQPPSLSGTSMQQSYGSHYSSHSSIGPVIAVLIVIVIFSIVAVMIGRLCSGRRIMGYGQYDIESWAETKCSTCIDGRISPPPPRPPPPRVNATGASVPVSSSMPVQTHQETKQELEE